MVDVPEMEYYQSNQQGEICVKGTCVFTGWVLKFIWRLEKNSTNIYCFRYFKDPQRTSETVDAQGWHHTGKKDDSTKCSTFHCFNWCRSSVGRDLYLKQPSPVIFELVWSTSTIQGDIGQWNPNGTLKIIDRKKHIFKLSQGEYIVPEKIENIYIKSQFVEQVFVHGESLKVRLKIFSFTCRKFHDFLFSF